jgi:hypothetical protein
MSRLAVVLGFPAVVALGGAGAAEATRFIDLVGATDWDNAVFEEITIIELSGDPGRLDLAIPRVESLPPGGEVACFTQAADVFHDCDPPASLENRDDWYTTLTWLPGTLAGRSRVTVRSVATTSCAAGLDGIRHDLSRLPGAYYTSFTPTIEYVPGIADAIRFLDENPVPGMPEGNLGLAQRWMAYLFGVIQTGDCDAPHGFNSAAWAWNAGVTDCGGFANMFASGLRTLAIPACVMTGYVMPDGPVIGTQATHRGSGGHAWAGAWSEGLQAFVPVDLTLYQFGFLDCQRVHHGYFEDMNHSRGLLQSSLGGARFGALSWSATGTNRSSVYPVAGIRHLDDGFTKTLLAHHVPNAGAPGDVSGVDEEDPSVIPAERLRVSTPFREALSLSLLLSEPEEISVEIFDVRGRRVARLADRIRRPAGEAFFRWLPGGTPSGVYLVRVRLHSGDQTLKTRVVRLR